MGTATKKLNKRILNMGFAFVLALSTVTTSASAFLGQTASATTAPLSVETLCVDEKVQVKVTARQAELPGIPANANAWSAGILGENINYVSDFGSQRNTLDEDDVDTHTFVTGQTAVPAGSVSAHVFGWYKTGLTWLFTGQSYENTLNASYLAVNCDATAPVATVSYAPDSLTNSSVLATITADEEIQDVTGWTRVDAITLEKSFTANTDELVTVADLAGNTTDVNVLIDWIDTEKPTILATPNAPAYISGTQEFDIHVTDNYPLDPTKNKYTWVEVYGDPDQTNKKGAKVDLSDGSGVFTLDTTLLPDGEYILRVGSVVDAAGNTSGDKTFRHFTVDNTNPQLKIWSPSDEDLISGVFDVTGEATDATSGVADVTYRVREYTNNGSLGDEVISWTSVPFDSVTGEWSFPLDLDDGKYRIIVRTTDNADNGRTKRVDVTVDSSAPIVTISNPVDGQTYANDVDLVASIVDDNLSHRYLTIKRNGAAYNIPGVTNTSIYSDEFVNETLATLTLEGDYTVKLEARDKAGNKTSVSVKTVSFTIDKSAPTIDISNLVVSTDKLLSFDLLASDLGPSGLEIVAANIYDSTNTTKLIELGSGSPTRLNTPHSGLPFGTSDFGTTIDNVDVSGLATGTYTIRAFARDHANNELRFHLVQFDVDNTAPDISVVSADENSAQGVTEPGLTVEVFVDGVSFGTTVADVSGDWELAFGSELAPGSYEVTATTEDTAGNDGTSSVFDLVVLDSSSNDGNPNNNDGGDNATPVTFQTTTPDNEGDEEEVLGAQDQNDDNGADNTGNGEEVLGDSDKKDETWTILGLTWYWWLLILVALGVIGRWAYGRFGSRNQ